MSKRTKKRLPRGNRKRDGLVTVEDVWGRKHRVPRAALPDPPPGAGVIDLTTPASTEAWLRKTGLREQFAKAGEVTIRNGDMAIQQGFAQDRADLVEQMERARTEGERRWLLERRAQMEDELVQLGLPRDAWRELSLMPLWPERVDEPEESCLLLEPWQRKGLTKRVLADCNDEAIKRSLWTAAVARVCTYVLEARNPESRLLLGRLLERFQAHRRYPDQGDEALRRLRAEQARGAGRLKAGKIAPHTVLVRATMNILKENGRRPNPDAVLALLTGGELDTDELLDAVRNALDPILLPDDGPPVDVEHGNVFFHFKNRPDRKITIARFRNAVSEATRLDHGASVRSLNSSDGP